MERRTLMEFRYYFPLTSNYRQKGNLTRIMISKIFFVLYQCTEINYSELNYLE